jgi:hypothetical protein
MVRLQLPEPAASFIRRAGIAGFVFLIFVAGCARDMKYKGNVDLSRYGHLKGRKIFIDPGHGGTASKDPSRRGPGSITEEEVYLRVALVLRSMLVKAGATVVMSRTKDRDVPLDRRVEAARGFSPDLLISIHHNGSLRSADRVNYPAVLIWGSRDVNARSYEFARVLLDEFQKIMDDKGLILSDYSVYPETGTMILRETRYLCPALSASADFLPTGARNPPRRHALQPARGGIVLLRDRLVFQAGNSLGRGVCFISPNTGRPGGRRSSR